MHTRSLTVAIAACSLLLAALLFGRPAAQAQEAALFPFLVNPWNVAPGNITNVAHWLERPAGKAGFVRAEGGRFVTADGKPIRFLGVNLSYGANFPTHRQAEVLADRLARFGINLVRFHHMDRYDAPDGLLKPGVFPREIDPEALDRLDYFVAQLKERGIYSNFNLKTARVLQPQEGFPYPGDRPTYDKGLDMFHREMIAEHQRIYKELLTHVNPYTGNAYIDEPAVVQIEISNENGMFYVWQRGELDAAPAYYLEALDALWNEWLRERYGSTDALRRAWNGAGTSAAGGNEVVDNALGLPEGESLESGVSRPTRADLGRRTEAVQRDYITFLLETDRAYFEEMYRFLKEELGVQSMVTGTQVPLSPLSVQARMDYVDTHMYFKHPQFPAGGWDAANWYFENVSMVNSDGGTIPVIAGLRVAGKPFTVSEYNHPAPNTYSSEGFLLAGAYGAFQDWSGIVAFDWSLNREYDAIRLTNYFNTKAHSTKLVTLPAVHALFVRGDVQVGREPVHIPAPDEAALYSEPGQTAVNHAAWSRGIRRQTSLQQRVARVVPGVDPGEAAAASPAPAAGSVWQSDTGELTWDRTDPDRSLVTVDTPQSKASIGYGAGRTITFKDGVQLEPGPTLQDGWSAITLTVISGEGFTGKANVLLTATGYIQNKGMVFRELSGGRTTLDSWGPGPVLVEGIPAKVKLVVPPERVRVYALDAAGNRGREVPVDGGEGGAVFEIGPEYQTLWYEVIID